MTRGRKRLLVAVLTTALLICSACGNTPQLIDDAAGSGEPTVVLEQSYSFTMGTSASGGSVYAIGAGLSKQLTEALEGLDMRAMSTGGAVDNVGLMERGEAQFALNASNTNFQAYNGELRGMEQQDNIRGICSLYPSVFHFIVTESSGITSFDQLAGTKGAVGPPASATDLYSTDLLGFYGYDYKDRSDVEAVFANTTDATDLFKDGHIDWALFPLGVPGSAVLDLTMTGNIDILPIDGADRDAILEQFPFYVPYTIPGGTYTGFDEDIETIGCVITMVADESVDEEVVYQITKYIWENLDSVKTVANALNWMEQDTAVQGIGVPLHPGAERYYKEIGWM